MVMGPTIRITRRLACSSKVFRGCRPPHPAAVTLSTACYERRGDGYLLMSVGSNGIDDGGDGHDGWINDGEWQTEPYLGNGQPDHVVGVPVPRRSTGERWRRRFCGPLPMWLIDEPGSR